MAESKTAADAAATDQEGPVEETQAASTFGTCEVCARPTVGGCCAHCGHPVGG
jgi:hypothetical protein